ncbi:hypothetical protein HIM_02634 [Hirsutella minnesotensis 3608]|nr:hypothetical protein HIM_02634 [Hirsutella minnesotensis 3608]
MLGRSSLPARPITAAVRVNDEVPRSESLNTSRTTARNHRRPSIFSQIWANGQDRVAGVSKQGLDKENFALRETDDAYILASGISQVVASCPEPFTNSKQRGSRRSSFLPNDHPLPYSLHDSHVWHDDDPEHVQIIKDEDPAPLILSPLKTLAALHEDVSECPGKLVPGFAERLDRARGASSEYLSHSPSSPRVISPASTIRINRLSLADLSRFSHCNDRLSYLRSSSTTSSSQPASADVSTGEAVEEATAAISGWQDEPRLFHKPCYNKYELADSSEVLPDDSLSRFNSPRFLSPGPLLPGKPRSAHLADMSSSTWHSLQQMKNQYDGPDESRHPQDPDCSAMEAGPRKKKRSASHFSLRSLTRPFVKRPRLGGFRKWATHVCRDGSRRLSQAYHRWKQQTELEQRQYMAWKANRRRERPADPLKGKSEPGFGAFTLERSRFGNQEWWKEGVAKYRAPSWMMFPEEPVVD